MTRNKLEVGMQCYFCKRVSPPDQIGDVSVKYNQKNMEHEKIVKLMPDRIKKILREGDYIGVWAHLRGFGCSSK